MRFSPGIYEHAAACIGRRPWEVSRNASLLAKAHQAAWEKYSHPLVVVGINVYNAEAEAYGAAVPEPSGNNIPSITTHPCEELEELRTLRPLDPSADPGIQCILEAGRILQSNCTAAEVRVPVCGPFALAAGLLGMNELLMSVIEDPEELLLGLRHLLIGQKAYLDAIHSAGLRPILFESGTTPPLLPVEDFKKIEVPILADLVGYGRKRFGEAVPCIVGGDAAPIARPLLETGPGYVIAPSETDQAAFLETAREFPEIHVRINISSTLLLNESFEPIATAADRAKSFAETRSNTTVGCGVVPYETDPATVIRLRDQIESHGDITER